MVYVAESYTYGINEIPVTVTSENGTAVKTYKINFVVMNAVDVSPYVTATGYNVGSGSATNYDDSYCTNLFTSSVSRTEVYIDYTAQGYIQADLGRPYRLTKFTYTKSNGEHNNGGLTITASNDPEFKNTQHDNLNPDLSFR